MLIVIAEREATAPIQIDCDASSEFESFRVALALVGT